MKIATPAKYGPDDVEVQRLRHIGGQLTVGHDPASAVSAADVVHTDTWISMGQENEADVRRADFAAYEVTEQLMSVANSGAKFMHCMPAHRDEEVSSEVFDGPRSLVIAQGHNRMHSARGALAFLVKESS
jgi:ornithine carbamoyltransferase